MKALQYLEIGRPPEVVEIPRPIPGPGQILLRVTAAGICQSDEHIMSASAENYRYGPLPLTLGHEGAGVVAALGPGVTGAKLDEAVAVYGPWGCGRCLNCSEGKENYCTSSAGPRPPGIERPGAIAEFMLINDARHLVPLDGLDPVTNVSLTDAGLTPYHAIKRSLPRLGAGSTVVVIGAGGLGHVGIQLIRALSSATVIALDISAEKLVLAREVGAHHTLMSGTAAAAQIRALTSGLGAQAVFDFVGTQSTVELASAVAAIEAEISIVGIGGGVLPFAYRSPAFDVSVRAPFWGSRSELVEVLTLARRGQVHVEVESFSLDEAPLAYERLRAGTLRGRAVIVP